jgi:hypothetical protein
MCRLVRDHPGPYTYFVLLTAFGDRLHALHGGVNPRSAVLGTPNAEAALNQIQHLARLPRAHGATPRGSSAPGASSGTMASPSRTTLMRASEFVPMVSSHYRPGCEPALAATIS